MNRIYYFDGGDTNDNSSQDNDAAKVMPAYDEDLATVRNREQT